VGFFLLEGELWRLARDWIQSWIHGERDCHPADWRERPLFASKAGARTRVHDHHLNARVGDLLKWATGNSKAQVYWLRKTRISERFNALWSRDELSARDVYGAMLRSGHVAIHTTIERYINDPATLLFADLKAAAVTPRSLLLAMSNLAPGGLDMAWSRAVGDMAARPGILLDRMGDECSDVAPERRTPPPEMRRAKSVLPMHIDAFARAMHRFKVPEDAVLAAGITRQQADQFNAAAAELITRRGHAPWRVSAQIDDRAVLPVPRRITGTERWFSLLERTPSSALVRLAESWVGQPHIARRFGEDIMVQIDQSHLLGVHELLSSTGLRMQVVSSGEYQLLTEQPGEAAHKGHAAALRWVLSIVWIYAQRTDY
jgi:hypothetical protein